jgi:hypothetical protein
VVITGRCKTKNMKFKDELEKCHFLVKAQTNGDVHNVSWFSCVRTAKVTKILKTVLTSDPPNNFLL